MGYAMIGVNVMLTCRIDEDRRVVGFVTPPVAAVGDRLQGMNEARAAIATAVQGLAGDDPAASWMPNLDGHRSDGVGYRVWISSVGAGWSPTWMVVVSLDDTTPLALVGANVLRPRADGWHDVYDGPYGCTRAICFGYDSDSDADTAEADVVAAAVKIRATLAAVSKFWGGNIAPREDM